MHYVDLVRSWFGNPLGVYAKTVKSPRTAELAATKSVITFDYGHDKRVFIASNHSHDFNPKMQRSFVQWEGMTGAMRAQMGVKLDYHEGRPDNLEYIVRGDAGWSDVPLSGKWFVGAFMGSVGPQQPYVQGCAGSVATSVA